MINTKISIQHLKSFVCLALLICVIMFDNKTSYASDGEEYVTITVYAEDDSDNLMYALDTTDPSAFSNSNTFTILSGTPHTIYVKDEAGNITSQNYTPESKTNAVETIVNEEIEKDKTEDIEIEDVDFAVEDRDFDYSSIFDIDPIEAPEPGMGTTYDKTKTDGSDDGEKVFYTVTTAEGDTFYMIVDQTQGTDNVYLLNTVTRSDLAALAVDDDAEDTGKKEKKEDNLLSALQKENIIEETGNTRSSQTKNSGPSPQIIVLIAVLIGGGVYYYIKVYKNKKDQQMDIMDAMDMEDFMPENEEDGEEELEFADDEKQEFLRNLIDEDEKELIDVDPTSIVDEDEKELIDVDPTSIVSPVVDFDTEYDPDLDGEEE